MLNLYTEGDLRNEQHDSAKSCCRSTKAS